MEIEVRGEKRTKAVSTPSGSKEEWRGEIKGKRKSRKEVIVTLHIVDLDRSRASCIVSLGRRWHDLCGRVFVYCPLQLTDFFLPVFTQVIHVRRLFLLLGYRPSIPSSKCFGYWLDMHSTYCWLIVVSAAAAFRFCLALLVAAVTSMQ